MSNSIGEYVWIGDLDSYVDIFALDDSEKLKKRKKWRKTELNRLGDASLLYGKDNKVDWRWALHQAELSLSPGASGQVLEKELVRALIDIGRTYSIVRYAKWEKITYPSALTASLPLGFRALLTQYLIGQGLLAAPESREHVCNALKSASQLDGRVAYRRAGQIQTLIHGLAYDSLGEHGPLHLKCDSTRTILSLARLHYSVSELRLDYFTDLSDLMSRYVLERNSDEIGNHFQGRYIPNWRLRHLRPLIEMYPISIREALERGVRHVESGAEIKRTEAVNELALAHLEILLMRKDW